MRMRHIVMYSLARFTMFFHTISKTGRFRGGGDVFEHKICVLIFSTTFRLMHFSFQKEVSEI